MAAEKSPSFQFYPRDYLSDIRVATMTNAERGMYITLLCVCWLEQSLPADPALLARLVACRQDRFSHAWNRCLARCFMVREDGRLIHKRLDAERAKQQAFSQLQAARGRLGGLAKASRGLADAKPARVLSSSSSTSVLSKGLIDTPVPPHLFEAVDKPDTTTKPLTPAELAYGARIVANRFGRCDHDPTCANSHACATRVAVERRRNGAGP